MQPHQERVVKEKEELDEKRRKLKAFIADDRGKFQGLDREEQSLLRQQLTVMDMYSDILRDRIAKFH